MNIGELVTVKTVDRKNAVDEKPTPYRAEIKLFSCIQQGNVELLVKQLRNLDSLIVFGKMSDDELTQHKYMAVSTITLAMRYAIQGGMSEKKAYEFSDRVIAAVDKLTDKNMILARVGAEIIRLTKEVRNCIKYINENLSQRISVTSAAKHCGISPDYLSQIFKKEIGEKLSTYILLQKLEKAKGLLLKGLSTKEVCRETGFSSPAYFATAFKRHYNMTPTEYVQISG